MRSIRRHGGAIQAQTQTFGKLQQDIDVRRKECKSSLLYSHSTKHTITVDSSLVFNSRVLNINCEVEGRTPHRTRLCSVAFRKQTQLFLRSAILCRTEIKWQNGEAGQSKIANAFL
jgi:hypothetical protein